MDTVFWTGIFIGFVLSVIASVIANLSNAHVTAFLESRQFKLRSRRKDRELKEFAKVKELKNGQRDKYLYFLFNSTTIILTAMIFFGCVILSYLSGTSDPDPIDKVILQFVDRETFRIGLRILYIAIALSGFWMFWKSGNHFIEMARRLDNFEEYEKEIKKKWGVD